MAQKKKNSKNTKFTPKQKQDYHNGLAKQGATKNVFDRSTGVVVVKKVSDFERGVHKAKADNIVKARIRAFKKHNSGK